ncbi:MAG: hypothetical protein VX797_08355 [Actinomycetota bacterium]|jgi:hypothetical protein|nr:hypothetical protein [Acidimicrobiaceae bacterium]MCH2621167.1 hypothetical protein [Acidimicrobiales bacterium]MEC7899990.1 hypothetical protein [Actinomycetota bacterium]|tara:strand:+ start:3960 stop:4271 length:312 start_codon:yes stop_codon:yes gene_type:complete
MKNREMTSFMFAETARIIGQVARKHNLAVPTFRSPPRIEEVHRSIRRGNDFSVVSVSFNDRPYNAVISDMIEGVLVANSLDKNDSDFYRALMWSSVENYAQAA